MQTEITTDYILRTQQNVRDRAWRKILSCIGCLNPSLPTIHDKLLDEIKKRSFATEYVIPIGSICVDSLPPEFINSNLESIKEEFLDYYSTWMDRYVPSAHVEVKLAYPFVEFCLVFTLLT
jgi:hypothetical protein